MAQIFSDIICMLGETCRDLCPLTKPGLPFDRSEMGQTYARANRHRQWLDKFAPMHWLALTYICLLKGPYSYKSASELLK